MESEDISVKKKEINKASVLKQVYVNTCSISRILIHMHEKTKSHHQLHSGETFQSKWL